MEIIPQVRMAGIQPTNVVPLRTVSLIVKYISYNLRRTNAIELITNAIVQEIPHVSLTVSVGTNMQV